MRRLAFRAPAFQEAIARATVAAEEAARQTSVSAPRFV
jgi:hypothetical protein